ncbi:hypothetical protein MBLNU459_g4541t2 [Dothideomycetes sp. NU459]
MKYPETYSLTPTLFVPNSVLPVLVYRNVLPLPHDQRSAKQALEKNGWIQGGVFAHYPTHHYHSVTHECYAVFRGSSHFLLGKGPLDGDDHGVEVDLHAGDIIVQPAGVAHCCLESTDDFAYIGVYPKGSPHWDNNFCKADEQETVEKASVARKVPIPDSDPIFGFGGPLVQLWREVD